MQFQSEPELPNFFKQSLAPAIELNCKWTNVRSKTNTYIKTSSTTCLVVVVVVAVAAAVAVVVVITGDSVNGAAWLAPPENRRKSQSAWARGP